MLSHEHSYSNSKKHNNHKKHRLNLKKNSTGLINKSNISQVNPPSKQLTEQKLQQRQLVERYIFSKLEQYSHKPRIWQLTHSSNIKRRLLDKTNHISKLYSIPSDFVSDSINQLFNDIDNHVSQLRGLIQSSSYLINDPNVLFQKVRVSNNQWRLLQLERAQQILPELDNDDLTEDELLQKYYTYIIESLTPKPDAANSNCIAQLREQPFDLDHAYEQAENEGKDYLSYMLKSYHDRQIPDLDLIKEMVNLGFQHMKTRPTEEEFENASSFLAKISLLHQTKQAYESGLHNMGDDFMLLRFGKIFGPNALPKTAAANTQFIYLVHLFIKSVSHLMVLMRRTHDHPEEIPSTITTVITDLFSKETNPTLIKLNDEHLFSPKLNIDQWTWLLEKWRDALQTFPIFLTEVGAFGRLLRTTIGIGIARLFNFAETIIDTNQSLDLKFMNEQLFHALQMGFYFGIAYAIVDCAQDEIRNIDKIPLHHLKLLNDKVSTPIEMLEKWTLIMEKLLCGDEFDRKQIPKTPLTPLLLETFDGLITLTKSIDATCLAFNELALLLRSQRLDKKTTDDFYNDEELFLGAMLKSHFTYTCTTFLGNIKSAREESERLWIMPLLGQLTDDCRDFYDDITSNSVTSFRNHS